MRLVDFLFKVSIKVRKFPEGVSTATPRIIGPNPNWTTHFYRSNMNKNNNTLHLGVVE